MSLLDTVVFLVLGYADSTKIFRSFGIFWYSKGIAMQKGCFSSQKWSLLRWGAAKKKVLSNSVVSFLKVSFWGSLSVQKCLLQKDLKSGFLKKCLRTETLKKFFRVRQFLFFSCNSFIATKILRKNVMPGRVNGFFTLRRYTYGQKTVKMTFFDKKWVFRDKQNGGMLG